MLIRIFYYRRLGQEHCFSVLAMHADGYSGGFRSGRDMLHGRAGMGFP